MTSKIYSKHSPFLGPFKDSKCL